LLRGKIILNIFSFQGHRTVKPRSKFVSKIYFLFNSKPNSQKLEFNTPLIYVAYKLATSAAQFAHGILLHTYSCTGAVPSC